MITTTAGEQSCRFCLCGCNCIIPSYDRKGRPIKYKIGHNRRKKHNRTDIHTEIDKVDSLELAKEIMYNQARIIYEQQKAIARLKQDCPTARYNTEYPIEYT